MRKIKEFLIQLFSRNVDLWKHLNHLLVVLFYSETVFNFLTINKQPLPFDHGFYLPRFIANRIYFLKNGFFHLPYYTPAFGGGMPEYGDPQNMSFSIPQFFFHLIPSTYIAVVATFFVASLLCYFGCYFLFSRFGFNKWISTAAAFAFPLNGFIVAHWEVGHLTTTPVFWAIPWILLLVHDLYLSESFRESRSKIIWLALLASIVVYGGGIITFFLAGLLALTMLVTFFWMGRRTSLVGLIGKLSVSVGAAVLISASRLVATADFMSVFPRYVNNYRLNVQQLWWLLVHCFFDPRMSVESTLPYNIGGAHAFCNYVGITTLAVLSAGLYIAFRQDPDDSPVPTKKTVKFFSLWTGMTLVASIYLAMGWNVGWLFIKPLPLMAANQGTYRFLGAMPLVILGLWAAHLNHWLIAYRKRLLVGFLCVGLVADIIIYHAYVIKKGGFDSPYANAIPKSVKNLKIVRWVNDDAYNCVPRGEGQAYVNNTAFGYGYRATNIDVMKPPLYEWPDGTFNVTDPVAMMYPKDIGRLPWSRIPVSVGREKVERFLAFEDPGFYVPVHQKVANAVSLLSFLLAWVVLALLRFRKLSSF